VEADTASTNKEVPMKTQLIQTAVAALTLAAAGYAQSAQELKVTVPFGFVAGSRTLPAGQYTVSQAGNPSAVVIRSAGSAPGVVVVTNRVESPDKQEIGKLVFHRYGDRYFLSEVWGTDQNAGSQLPKTAPERNLAQNSRENLATIFVSAP
jgi:hypothetical protein